jgi:Mitochondrial carrier protein
LTFLKSLQIRDYFPLWSGFAPILSRELPFAVVKFLTFDLLANIIISFLNAQTGGSGALPVQVGVGPIGLTVSAAAGTYHGEATSMDISLSYHFRLTLPLHCFYLKLIGAVAGIAGAIVSHPADLILTKTSAAQRNSKASPEASAAPSSDWRDVVKDLIRPENGGVSNLFVGLPARATFFFLVIGLQFFLYDYVKSVFQVGSDDLSLVLDVFYAVRAGLVSE